MDKSINSDKYQVVIPKMVREALNSKEWPDGYIGGQKDIWRKVDVAHYLRAERDSWSNRSA